MVGGLSLAFSSAVTTYSSFDIYHVSLAVLLLVVFAAQYREMLTAYRVFTHVLRPIMIFLFNEIESTAKYQLSRT
jgi:hypothetical protein